MVESHYKNVLRQLLRLNKNTPRCVILFLAGSLPGTALLHLRQLSLFGMICRRKECLLKQHALNIFSYATVTSTSWFLQIRDICILYSLPYPHELLKHPPSKNIYKKMVKSRVIDYWENQLRKEAAELKSLTMFKPQFMSLTHTHPMWTTAQHVPYKVSMANIQALMLSGRYPCGTLVKHWSRTDGCCKLSSTCASIPEDIIHILQACPALTMVRERLLKFTLEKSRLLPGDAATLLIHLSHPSRSEFCGFLLDCSASPPVIRIVQKYGNDILHLFFEVTRTWSYVLHRERLKLLGLWRRSRY